MASHLKQLATMFFPDEYNQRNRGTIPRQVRLRSGRAGRGNGSGRRLWILRTCPIRIQSPRNAKPDGT